MGFFSKLMQTSKAEECVLPETHAVMRQIVAVLGFDVVAAPNYASSLVPALNSAIEYLDGQIAAIPGPLDISAAHFSHDPLVHALFPARQEIARGIGRSQDVKQSLAFLSGADQPEAFGLLGVRREKDSASMFVDHTLRSLAATESGARQGIRTAALMRRVAGFGEHIDKLRKRGQLPGEEWNIENRRDLAPETGKLVLSSEELQPDNLLRGLVGWLQRPAEMLQVSAGAGGAGGAGGAPLGVESLPRLVCHDRRRWIVCLVRFPTAEGVAAVQNEPSQYRYIRI